jgi:hypothetical protein
MITFGFLPIKKPAIAEEDNKNPPPANVVCLIKFLREVILKILINIYTIIQFHNTSTYHAVHQSEKKQNYDKNFQAELVILIKQSPPLIHAYSLIQLMRAKFIILLFIYLLQGLCSRAQQTTVDSFLVARTMKELFILCRTVDFNDPKVIELGLFYKAAPYIIYHGADSSRAWKDFANYKNEEERKGVDDVCLRINGTINRDPDYKVVRYFTETEPEGTRHLLIVSYNKRGVAKKAVFVFFKIGERFGLVDID